MDHFVVLDFNGFKRTIDALGGVEVCLTRPLRDEKSGVDLPAGRTRVSGEEALGFVRVRHNIGALRRANHTTSHRRIRGIQTPAAQPVCVGPHLAVTAAPKANSWCAGHARRRAINPIQPGHV